MPKQVGDAEAWRAQCEGQLQRAGAALNASERLSDPLPNALILEESALWIGPDENRPSSRLDTDAIASWLDEQELGTPGTRAACLLLGQRGRRRDLRGEHQALWQTGRLLSRWSLDTLCRLQATSALVPRLEACLSMEKRINSLDAARGVEEFLVSDENADAILMLKHLTPVFTVVDRFRDEPERRRRIILQILEHAASGLSCDVSVGTEADTRSRPFSHHRKTLFEEAVDAGLRSVVASKTIVVFCLSKDRYSAAEVFELVLGFDWGRIPEVGDWPFLRDWHTQDGKNALLSAVSEGIRRHAGSIDSVWSHALTVMAGRLHASTGSADVISHAIAWCDKCRTSIPPGYPGDIGFQIAVANLETAMGFTRLKPDETESTLAALSSNRDGAMKIISEESRGERSVRPADATNLFSALSLFNDSQARLSKVMIDLDLARAVCRIAAKRRDMVVPYLEWIESLKCDRVPTGPWTELFCRPEPAPSVRIAQWVHDCVASGKMTWIEADSAVGELMSWCDEEAPSPRGAFLATHFSLVERIFSWLCADASSKPDSYVPTGLADWLDVMVIFFWWHVEGVGDPAQIVDVLMAKGKESLEEGLFWREDSVRLAVLLCGGDPVRLLQLLRYDPDMSLRIAEPFDGWYLLSPRPAVRHHLIKAAGASKEFMTRTCELLLRASVTVRLKETDPLNDALERWEHCEAPSEWKAPDVESPELAQVIARLSALRVISGGSDELPRPIARLLNRYRTMERERESLQTLNEDGKINDRGRKRLANLTRYLADRESLIREGEREALAAAKKRIVSAGLEALEHLVEDVIAAHSVRSIGPRPPEAEVPDWDNALLLCSEIKDNRRALRLLLKSISRGETDWIAKHPKNVEFRERVKHVGVDVDAWSAPHEQSVMTRSGEWRASVEMNPLHVMQMGNLFGTCLSQGKVNAFSVVANAIEDNKHVLYARNAQGQIIGRRLIALTSDGELVGFYSYGSEGGEHSRGGGSPWVKILFDILIARLAKRIGAHLFTEGEIDIGETKKLSLFLKRYHDSTEDIEWWATLAAGAGDDADGRRAALDEVQVRLAKPQETEGDDPLPPRKSLLRAMLWLGADALPAVENHDAAGRLESHELRYLERHSPSEAVQEVVCIALELSGGEANACGDDQDAGAEQRAERSES